MLARNALHLIALGLFAAALALCPVATIAGDPEGPAAAYYWFTHWVSVGRLDAAASQFAADAIVVVAPSCPSEAPCIGRAAIRDRYVARIARFASERPLVDQRLDGTTMYAHDERSYRRPTSGESDWRDGRYACEVRDGLIASLAFGLAGSQAASATQAITRSAGR